MDVLRSRRFRRTEHETIMPPERISVKYLFCMESDAFRAYNKRKDEENGGSFRTKTDRIRVPYEVKRSASWKTETIWVREITVLLFQMAELFCSDGSERDLESGDPASGPEQKMGKRELRLNIYDFRSEPGWQRFALCAKRVEAFRHKKFHFWWNIEQNCCKTAQNKIWNQNRKLLLRSELWSGFSYPPDRKNRIILTKKKADKERNRGWQEQFPVWKPWECIILWLSEKMRQFAVFWNGSRNIQKCGSSRISGWNQQTAL